MMTTTTGDLRIVFVTPEEPSVMPSFFEAVMPSLRHEIVAVAVVSPIYKRSSWARQAKRFVEAFGLREFAIEALQFAGYKAADAMRRALRIGSWHSVTGVASAHGVPVLKPDDVNAPVFLDTLRTLRPDLVISVSCPQIFGRELLALPRLGCVNLHSALLPRYRGMLPTFWVLAAGERETGVTLHYMTPGIDGGDIILQQAIPIAPDDTLRSLMRRCKAVAAALAIDGAAALRNGGVRTLPNPPDEGSYHSFPTRADVRRFKALGRRLR